MTTKQTVTLALLGALFQGCTTYKNDYDHQSFFGVNPNYATSAQRDNNAISNAQNPMARPSYGEYRDSIGGKEIDNSSILP